MPVFNKSIHYLAKMCGISFDSSIRNDFVVVAGTSIRLAKSRLKLENFLECLF